MHPEPWSRLSSWGVSWRKRGPSEMNVQAGVKASKQKQTGVSWSTLFLLVLRYSFRVARGPGSTVLDMKRHMGIKGEYLAY